MLEAELFTFLDSTTDGVFAARESGEAWGRALLTALGPGFSAGFAVLEG